MRRESRDQVELLASRFEHFSSLITKMEAIQGDKSISDGYILS